MNEQVTMLTFSSILPSLLFCVYKLTVYLTNPINVNFVCFYVFLVESRTFPSCPSTATLSPSINVIDVSASAAAVIIYKLDFQIPNDYGFQYH